MVNKQLRRQVLYSDDVADEDIILPEKKPRDENAEWRIQAKCVTAIRKAQKTDKTLRFIATMSENHRDKARAAMAKLMGLQSGIADIILLRREPHTLRIKVAWVELKRPGKTLSDAQEDWWAWIGGAWERHLCVTVEEFKVVLGRF